MITGETPLDTLMHQHPGEIKAQILEDNGNVIMRKTCPKHGQFDDVMATDPEFLRRIDLCFLVATFAWPNAAIHRHAYFEHQIWAWSGTDR